MSYGIPDEKGEFLEIPKELYSEIRNLIRSKKKDTSKISFHPTNQKEWNNFFQNKFLPKDKRNS